MEVDSHTRAEMVCNFEIAQDILNSVNRGDYIDTDNLMGRAGWCITAMQDPGIPTTLEDAVNFRRGYEGVIRPGQFHIMGVDRAETINRENEEIRAKQEEERNKIIEFCSGRYYKCTNCNCVVSLHYMISEFSTKDLIDYIKYCEENEIKPMLYCCTCFEVATKSSAFLNQYRNMLGYTMMINKKLDDLEELGLDLKAEKDQYERMILELNGGIHDKKNAV
jgi:hypothetical protein